MDLDVVFLGTAASVPSTARGLSSMLIRRGGEQLLIDCGEGTQRQLMRSTGLVELDAILITHTHADHVLGLPGMLKTFNLRERERPLVIAGPPPVGRLLQDMRPLIGTLTYDIELELGEGHVAWRGDGYHVRSVPVQHRGPAVAWVLEEEDRPGRFDVDRARELGVSPGSDFGVLQRGDEVTVADGSIVRPEDVLGEARTGRRIVYTGDTCACSAVRDAARNATLLVHEATFLQEDADRARITKHSTALDAALTAAAANVQMLALTHISTRYRPRDLEAEASTAFEPTIVARDFDVIDLPFPERGAPRHEVRGARSRRDGTAVEPVVSES
jgi:ribonuclease Z